MAWKLSRYRAGDLVEVKGREEILATLDEAGCVEGMPFMPEMFKYCGRRLRVSAVAHKTCDVARKTRKARRLETMVHLEGAACDGSAHGGCQADCNLFWKDVWLRPANTPSPSGSAPAALLQEADLQRLTVAGAAGESGPVYSCQATRLFDATEPLAWWNPRQYWLDLATGNHTLGTLLRVGLVGFTRFVNVHVPRGYRISHAIYAWTHRRLFGRGLPNFSGKIPKGQPTPTRSLGLKPGERVRIRSQAAIEETLDSGGRNRGLYCDVELAPFCGTEAVVRKSVTQFIDDSTGLMLQTKQPSVMLDGVACLGLYSDCRLLCPRAIPSYWREIWLERISDPASPAPDTP